MDPVSWTVGLILAAGAWFGWRALRGRQRDPNAVRDLLAGLGEDYTVISGLVRVRPQGVDEIDHLIVSPFGVFVVMEVREPGRIQCRINDMDWPVRGPGKKAALHNPVWRNRKRLNALEEELPGIPLISLVVIVNGRIAGEAGPEVVPFDALNRRIREFRQTLLTAEQMDGVLGRLKEKP